MSAAKGASPAGGAPAPNEPSADRGVARRQLLTPVRVVVAVGLSAIAAAAVAILLQREPRRAGTNLTADVGFVIPLQAGQQLCEPDELLPGDTGALRLSASSGASPGPALAVSVSDQSGSISAGRLAPGWRSGQVSIPIAPIARSRPAAMVCVRNLGASPVSFGGSVPDADFYVAINGKPLNGRLRIEYMRPGAESWFSLIPTLLHRFSLAKGGLIRHWAAAAALVLMLLAVALATRTTLRAEGRR